MVDIKPEYQNFLDAELNINYSLNRINYQKDYFKNRIFGLKRLKVSYFQNFYNPTDGSDMTLQEWREPDGTNEVQKKIIVDLLRIIRSQEDLLEGSGRVFGFKDRGNRTYFVFLRDILHFDLWIYLQ